MNCELSFDIQAECPERGVSPTDWNVGVSPTDRNVGVSPTDWNVGVSPTDWNAGVPACMSAKHEKAPASSSVMV